MARVSKKQKKILETIKQNHLYSASEAINLLKQFASTKFRESLDISVNLGVDPRKSDQVVRSSTNLPKGTGKVVRVAVFAQAVKDAKSGQVRYRNDKNGIIHCTVGKVDFAAEDIIENMIALINDLKKAKPTSSKGQYLKKISLSTTMGPGIAIDISSIPV